MARDQRWLIIAMNLLAVILLAFALSQLTWRILSPDTINKAGQTPDVNSSSSQLPPDARLRAIGDLHLFGQADVAPPVDAPIVAPETRLQLKLKGVFASTHPEQAFAIISDNKNKDKAYRLGSKVAGGAILHAVYADRVILKRNGRLETLRLTVTYDKTRVQSKTTYSRTTSSPRQVIQAPQKLKNLKQTLLKEPHKIWKQVRVSPVLNNGSIKGYTVEHQDKQLMRSLSLQKGDVITAVNGKSLSDPASLYGLMNQLTNNKTFNVTIERNNQVQTIQLQM